MADTRFALRARWVLPVCQPPIAGGIVVIDQGEIVDVGVDAQGASVEDLGDVALLPGLVNAHTHLEFSDLPEPLGTSGSILPDWIREVIEHRRATPAGGATAIARGLSECLTAGSTTIGEIATTDWRCEESIPEVRPLTVMFHEAIGPMVPRAQAAAAAAEDFLRSRVNLPDVFPALSPHAPYTVHPRLLAALVESSQRHRVPLAMHLAESREELELLNLGSGPFRDMLEAVGAWDGADGARLSCILDYLTELARAERALVIHGNYLDDEEIAFLGDHAEKMSVVYCPRTHLYFEHEPYPLAAMLSSGVTVALGTDSRASNPDLSLLSEMRAAAEVHPDVAPEKVLEIATLGGARALGFGGRLGTLEAGKRADFVAVDAAGARNPVEEAVRGAGRVVAVWVAGRRVC